MNAEIIPLIRLPRSQGIFDYHLPTGMKISAGYVVRIPFGRRRLFGLVWKIKKAGSQKFALKEIESVYNQLPPLPASQLQVIEKLSEYYLVSRALFASLFVPEGLERKKIAPRAKALPRLKFTKPLAAPIRHFLRRRSSSLILTHRPNYPSLVGQLITEILSGGQHLVIVPDFLRLELLLEALPSPVRQSAIVVHGKLSKGALVQAYVDSAVTENCLIIGTRRAIFSPMKNLKSIWLIDEDDPSHKQYDLNPRFDTGTVAEMLSEATRAKLYRTSLSPSLSTWQHFRTRRTSVLRLGTFAPIRYIITAGQGSLLPPDLENEIQERVEKKQRLLFLTQQRGEASSIRCSGCGFVFTCPACEAIIGRASLEALSCKRCQQKIAVPRVCPRCKSTRLHDFGLTPSRLAAQLKSTLPGTEIGTVVRDAVSNPNAPVVIGTEHVFSFDRSFDLAIVVSLEQLLSRPSFEVEFRAWQLLMRLRSRATAVVVLGAMERHQLITALNADSWSTWYEAVWKQREQWHYPPPWQVLKLLHRNSDEKTALSNARDTAKWLRTRLDKNAEVIGPYPRYPYQSAGTYRHAILVRWPAQANPPDLSFLYAKDFDDWQVDVNPLDSN